MRTTGKEHIEIISSDYMLAMCYRTSGGWEEKLWSCSDEGQFLEDVGIILNSLDDSIQFSTVLDRYVVALIPLYKLCVLGTVPFKAQVVPLQ